MSAMDTGQKATLEFTVDEDDTATAVGSGDLAVLATPRLVAWCEAASCAAIADSLPAHQTSVSSRVQFEHLAASPVGEAVSVTATVGYVDGRLVRFEVVASHPHDGKVVGHGEATRVVVDRERFLSRVSRD
jgi:predicted thioesterase